MNNFSNPMSGQNMQGNGVESVNTIPLATLIEFMVTKTYHEIVVMADLLPSKPDMERKIQIAQFAYRTRQSYIRLLALVKWASSVGKVSRCGEITTFLDQQSMLFVDTADKLHTLARQLVVQARLPNFSVPAAIDVLTTGTYPRLPKCIKDKIVPPDPITLEEKNATLKRLDQIIMYNLVTTEIPPQFSELVVRKGMVTLVVPNEFKVFLTLMSDEANEPWILLKLEILVQDKEIGGGKKLVHDMQVDYLHKLVQSRIIGNEKPFKDLYNLLHTFCLSLQLEVLRAQAHRLSNERWGRLIQIDDYNPGQKISLSYWKWNKQKTTQAMQVMITQFSKNDNRILKVSHNPPLSMQNLSLVEKASKLSNLSIEQLLSDTVAVRSYQKLYEIKELLQKHIKNDSSQINETLSFLKIPLGSSSDCTAALIISVDPHTGRFIPYIGDSAQADLDEIEKSINTSIANVLTCISKLKVKHAVKSCETVLQAHKNCAVDTPLLIDKESHPILSKLSDTVIYIKLTKFSGFYVVVEINHDDPLNVKYQYYFLSATISKISPNMGLEIESCVQIFLNLDAEDSFMVEKCAPKLELGNVLSITSARVPYIKLLEELNEDDVIHQVKKNLQNSLLECVFRHGKGDENSWNVELVFCNRPFKTEKQKNDLTRIVLNLDAVKSSDTKLTAHKKLVQAWQSITRLHGPVLQFAEVLKDPESNLSSVVQIQSYTYTALTLKCGFGNGKQLLLTIRWSIDASKFILQFGKASAMNGSTMFNHFYLSNMFNMERDIGRLVQVLHDTAESIQVLFGLPILPVLGLTHDYQQAAQQRYLTMNFTTIAQSPTHFRLTFREMFAIDVYCLPNSRVGLRDGSLSQYDSTQVKESLIPIPGLRSFLMKFDDKKTNQSSREERDDPPSPDSSQSSVSAKHMKIIPKGVWSGSSLFYLSATMFGKIVKPINNIQPGAQYCPSFLETFLGYTLILRTFRLEMRKGEEQHYKIPNDVSDDPTTLVFCCHTLRFMFGIRYQDGIQLSVNVSQVPPNILQERGINQNVMWKPEELLLIEKFFQARVVIPPFRAVAVRSFLSIISTPAFILRNFVRLMQLEFMPPPNMKWLPRLCLTVPPKLSFFNNCGVPAVHYFKDKVIIFCEFKLNTPQPADPVILPFIWSPNQVPQMAQRQTITTLNPQVPIIVQLATILKQFNDRTPKQEINLVSAIHFVAENFRY